MTPVISAAVNCGNFDTASSLGCAYARLVRSIVNNPGAHRTTSAPLGLDEVPVGLKAHLGAAVGLGLLVPAEGRLHAAGVGIAHEALHRVGLEEAAGARRASQRHRRVEA